MVLQHGLGDLTAKWNNSENKWDIGEATMYRWCTTIEMTPVSEWFSDIKDALQWIIKHDEQH